MEVARHVIDTFFRDVPNPLVRHHLDSFDDLLSTKIPGFIRGKNPLTRNLTDGRLFEIYVGGKDGNEFTYSPPVDEGNAAVLPHTCRTENKTYSLEMRGTIEIHYIVGTDTDIVRFEDVTIGRIPLMLKSPLCYLSTMQSSELYGAGECKFELGGYFIIGGSEKCLLTQEKLGDNMFYASKRVQPSGSSPGAIGLVEKEDTESKIAGATKAEKYEYIAGIRTLNEAGTRGPHYHFLVIPPKNVKPNDYKTIANTDDLSVFSKKRLVTIKLPGFSEAVPLVSVFYALGLSNHKDIYDTVFAGIPESERTIYDELFSEIVLSHDVFLEQVMKAETDQNQDANLLILKRQCRTPTQTAVYVNLYNDLFSHCEPREGESAAVLYRRKAYLLGNMLKMAMDVALDIKPKSDRDHYRYKRLSTSGDLCFEQFRRVYRDVSNNMLLRMEERAFYESNTYAGKKIKNLIQDTPNNYWWTSYTFLSEFEKAFKGQWGGKNGVSQELLRFSYPGTVAMLRRVNLDMDKDTKAYEARRIHGSSWGFMCPTDNPDGGNVGMIKSMTLLCSITTTVPSKLMYDIVTAFKNFKPITLIHPAKWNPAWTKVHINSDLVGVFEKDAEEFHYDAIQKRRSTEIPKFVSLCWNRYENEYIICTDAGRVSRPLYREGVKAEAVKRMVSWKALVSKAIDYVDPQETESLLVKMEPFSDRQLSEIHGITSLSASASIVPNSDFSQSVRSMFSCQQIKHACSWFNTAFNKRFDTHATWLNSAQQPLSQTWTARRIMGGDGCLPYGENSIVALATYSGYNQEDSIILNDSAVKRGMFNTVFYHSYDVQEEMINVAAGTNTEFANVLTNSRFRETVVPKQGVSYEKLDGDGIILAGSEVTQDTVLVSIVVPVTNEGGQVVGYSDKSFTPGRGEKGVVDSVFRYVTREGLHGVKIRIAKFRTPEFGDKFCSRHGQKGTVGIRLNEEDMPYTASGLRPDMIVNPHAFPSRMTIGQFIEGMACKAAAEVGTMVDSTPFSTQDRVGETRDLLKKLGMHPYGHEVMYNGQTGEMLESEIFIGPTYYLCLKLVTEDKINYRTTGPRTLLTRQPVEGRANDGALRIGEMERDCLISHGISKFLHESMMDRSDGSEILFQPETGYLDSSEKLEGQVLSTPYSLGLVLRELEAMHISVRLAAP
jgi:DNA-directed RNA polymerase II subunit RPB2